MRLPSSIRYQTKLVAFLLLSIGITMLAGLYSYLSIQNLMDDSVETFQKNYQLANAYREVELMQKEFETYFSTSSSDSLVAFYNHSAAVGSNIEELRKTVTYTERGIHVKNISNMMDHYLQCADDAVRAKRGRMVDNYTQGYADTVKENRYITRYMEKMMSTDLIGSAERYAEISRNVGQITMFNNLLIAAVAIFMTVAIGFFSAEMTRPLSQLASYAQEISGGNFDVQIPENHTSREVSVLYRTFRLMAANIKEHVEELRQKQRIESALSEQKVNNLKMKTALRESELLALQSQVNPHFIFNTINIGAQLAMLHGDNITCTYFQNAADIFRYNLRGLDTNATLRQELENINAYMNLLQTRFGDTVQFRQQIEEKTDLLDFVLPRMTLQPLVENAYIHGISEREDGGVIRLAAWEEGDEIRVAVCDNGKGMTPEKIEELLHVDPEEQEQALRIRKSHVSGIGVDNVLQRLRLFYGRTDVMEITCEEGETCFLLKLPKQVMP